MEPTEPTAKAKKPDLLDEWELERWIEEIRKNPRRPPAGSKLTQGAGKGVLKLKLSRPGVDYSGGVIYSGPSMLERGVDVACIMTFTSSNAKTGGMRQTTIIRTDLNPWDARTCGRDKTVCGSCPQRPFLGGGCYVSMQSLLSIWDKLNRLPPYGYPLVPFDMLGNRFFEGLTVRIGTYGDPTAVPIRVWYKLLGTGNLAGWTGYTHQWRNFPDFKTFCMASVDSKAEAEEASSLGWRYFRSRPWDSSEKLLPHEFICPAANESPLPKHKRLHCADCRLCGGTEGRSGKSAGNPVIKAHGTCQKRHKSLNGLALWPGIDSCGD